MRAMHWSTHFRHQDVDCAAVIDVDSSDSAAAEQSRVQDQLAVQHGVVDRVAKNVPTEPELSVENSENYSVDYFVCTPIQQNFGAYLSSYWVAGDKIDTGPDVLPPAQTRAASPLVQMHQAEFHVSVHRN